MCEGGAVLALLEVNGYLGVAFGESLDIGTASLVSEVVALMENVKSSMGEWESAGDTETEAVESLRALDVILIPHLDDEESTIVPLASRYLTPQEWGQLPGHAMGHFGGDKIWLIIGLIRENFSEAQRQMMLEKMPPPARQMWESMGEAAFTDLIAQVRQTG